MKIEEIRLKEFLSHQNTVVTFNDKVAVNVIIGQNGAGKTSLIQGVLFSLFREGDKGNIANMIRKTSSAKESSVFMRFSHNGHHYEVERNLAEKGKSKDDVLYMDSRPIARGAQRVTDELTKILGATHNVAFSTFIVKEGKILDSIDEKNLGDTLSEIMKIDKLDKLIDSSGYIREVLREIEGDIKALKEIESQLQKDEEYLNRRRLDLDQEEGKQRVAMQKLKIIEDEVASLKVKVEQLEERRVEYNQEMAKKRMIEGKIETIRAELEKESKELEELPRLRQEMEGVKEFKEIEAEVREYANYKRTIKTQRETLEGIRKRRLKLESDLNDKKQLKPYYDKFIEIDKRLEENNRKLNNLEGKKARLDAIRKELLKLESEIASASSLARELKLKEEELESKQRERDSLNNRLSEIKATMSEIEDTMSRLNQIQGDTCPVCGGPLDEQHRAKIMEEKEAKQRELSNERNQLRERLKVITSEIETLTKSKNDLMKRMGELEASRKRKKSLEEEIESLMGIDEEYEKLKERIREDEEVMMKEGLKEKYRQFLNLEWSNEDELKELVSQEGKLEESIENLQKRLETLERKMKGLSVEDIMKRIKRFDELDKRVRQLEATEALHRQKQQELSRMEEELTQINEAIRKASFDEKEYEDLKRSLDEKNRLFQKISAISAEISGKVSEMRREIEEVKKRIEENKERVKEIDKLEKSHQKLTKLREDLGDSGLRSFLISNVTSMLTKNINDILGKFDLSFRNVEIERDNSGKRRRADFRIKVYNTRGDELSVENLSGGEKISLALATRLALTKLISNPGFMILDEPTIHLDEERRKKLIDVIKAVNEVVPQILVITHDEEVLEAADVIFRVRKENGTSKVEIERIGDLT